jgi:hypothetical protein
VIADRRRLGCGESSGAKSPRVGIPCYHSVPYLPRKRLPMKRVRSHGATIPVVLVSFTFIISIPPCVVPESLQAQDRSGTGNKGWIPPCPRPHVDTSAWKLVNRDKFTFRLPKDFEEIKVQGIDSWVGQFQTSDSSIVVSFDCGSYSDPLTRSELDVSSNFARCEERIGERRARLISFWRFGDTRFGAGAAWREIAPKTHLTFFGWARDRRELERLLTIFRTVRFGRQQ